MKTILYELFARRVAGCPSLTDEEREAALTHGPEAFAEWLRRVDDDEDPSPLAGLKSNRCMMLSGIATGRPGPWDEIK